MSSLKKQSIVAFAWDLGGTIVRMGSGLVISILLARLLGPAEFGLVGMAMVFIGISQVFIDVGFTAALIQNKENSDLTYSSVFYLNFAAGLALTLLFYFIAPMIGIFYENPQITDLVRWLSLIFVFNSLNMVQQAIFQRNLSFKILTIRTVISSAFGGVIGVVAALQGLGVYSLVIQQLSAAVLGTILLWHASEWRPNLQFSLSEIKKLSGFSLFIFFNAFTASIFNKLDVLFIGKIFSPVLLGLYTRSESLCNTVTNLSSNSIRKVTFPVLSSLQNNKERFDNMFFKSIELTTFISFVLTGVLFLFGADIILLLFGEKWKDAIPIFEILILRAATFPINVILLNALNGIGKAKENFMLGVVRKTLKLSTLLIGFFFGFQVFLISFLIFHYIMTLFNSFVVSYYIKVNAWKTVLMIFESALPLSILIFTFWIYQFSLLEKMLVAVLYVTAFYIWGTYRGNSGLTFAKNYFLNLISRR